MFDKNKFLKFQQFLFIQLLIIIEFSIEIQIAEFTLNDINELYENEGGKFSPSTSSPTDEYYQLCVFSNQLVSGPWNIPPQINITQDCYNKILNKNSGAKEIIIYKFFRIRNTTTELEPVDFKSGIKKVYEVYYQLIYFKNNDIEETRQIDVKNICNENILVYYSPTISDDLKTSFLNVAKQNPYSDENLKNLQKYDIFNTNSDFYTSICTPYTYNTFVESFIIKQTALKYYDISLEKRKLYFPGALELCPVTCDYIGIMRREEELSVVCECDDQHYDLLGGTVPSFQSFTSYYYDEDKFNSTNKDNYFSIDVIGCLKVTLMQAFQNNYGSYITLGIGVVIVLAYIALFIWGKWRILSIFELIYNNNVNLINYMKNQGENNKFYENSQISNINNNNIVIHQKYDQNDLAISISSKRGLNPGNQFIHNNLLDNHLNNKNIQIKKNKSSNISNNNRVVQQKIQNERKNENQKAQNENEENEELDEEEEEEEDDELYPNPPRKKIVKKKRKQTDEINMNPNYEISQNEIQSYIMSSNEEPKYNNFQNKKYYEDSHNIQQNINNKKNNLDEQSEEYTEEEKRKKINVKLENDSEQKTNKKPEKRKKTINETDYTIDETNYNPDIISSQIVMPIDNIFTDQELNTMTLEEMSQYDRRTFFEIYFSILNTKAPIFFIFSYYNSNKGISFPLQIKYPAIKLIFFCIILYICFFFNATVYGTKSMTYRLDSKYSFGKHIAFGVILAPFCLIIKSIIYFLIFYEVTQKIVKIKLKCFTSILISKDGEKQFSSIFEEEEDKEIKKDYNTNFEGEDYFNDSKKEIKQERMNLKILIIELFDYIKKRIIISIVCMVIIILFIWYYIAAFCVCYRNSQVSFLLNILLTFLFCNIIPCFYCFIPAYLRKLAFDKQNKNILICSKIFQVI